MTEIEYKKKKINGENPSSSSTLSLKCF